MQSNSNLWELLPPPMPGFPPVAIHGRRRWRFWTLEQTNKQTAKYNKTNNKVHKNKKTCKYWQTNQWPCFYAQCPSVGLRMRKMWRIRTPLNEDCRYFDSTAVGCRWSCLLQGKFNSSLCCSEMFLLLWHNKFHHLALCYFWRTQGRHQ